MCIMYSKVFYVLIFFKLAVAKENCTLYYDAYKGEPITEENYGEHVVKNTTYWCTNVLEPCDPDDWRRIDGSCNNLNHPNRGMPHTPTLRLLPPVFSGNGKKGYEPRKAKDGGPLPPERPLRTSLLPEGRAPNQFFTQLVTHFVLYLVPDILSIHDTVNFVEWRPYCCTEQGKKDRACIPVNIPNDDPVHRFGHLRCMRLTRPLTYQSQGCVPNNTVPERIVSSTPTIDLSHLYGSNPELLNSRGRLFKGGLLKYEEENGKIWPPSTKTPNNLCILNQPGETRCHYTPEDGVSNSLAGINIFGIWFWRMHNYIAKALVEINPCWDDDRLFYTARDINIAFMVQIAYYELYPLLLGPQNLAWAGVISYSPGFRDLYNEQFVPQITAEYAYAIRWFHVMQENEQKMYDSKGCYLRSIPLTNITQRTGYLANGHNLDHMTQGTYRQPCGGIDGLVDYDIAEIGLGPLTDGTDITTFDLVKNRHFGLAPYVKYLEHCNERTFTSFDDLQEFIKPAGLDILKDKYKHVENVDLMAALWVEYPAMGSFLPRTLQCVMTDQLLRFPMSDRHWYERPNRPHAFTLEQLLEIRKAKISRLLCNVGDSVTEIQANAFLRIGPGNELISCDEIPNIDFQAWKDPACSDACCA